MTAQPPLILPLSDARDAALVGGKAVNLASLLRGGFPVPQGFVITTAAYHRRRANGEADPELAVAIVDAWRALGSAAVAVRSSATAEDQADASMAGQYQTILNVSDEKSLLDAVRACWGSIDSPRTRTYLAEHGIDPAAVAMAVIVQRLVPAEVSGVMFTADPHTGSRRQMLIEATWGLGEALVSGLVQPDVVRLDRDSGRVLDLAVADKPLALRPGGGEPAQVDPQRRSAACLGDDQIRQLWRMGRRLAEVFGAEQDVEWAFHDGSLYVLQARAITTLAETSAYEQALAAARRDLGKLLAQGRGPFVLHNVGETLKNPTPLTWSIVRRFMSGEGGYGRVYRMVGFRPSPRVCREGFLQLFGGRIYMDAALAGEMFFADYPFRYDVELLRRNPAASQLPPTVPVGSAWARVRAAARVRRAGRRIERIGRMLDRQLVEDEIPRFVDWCRQERARDLAALSNEQWLALWRQRHQHVMEEFAPRSLLPSLVLASALAELRRFIEECFWDEDAEHLTALLACSAEPDMTVRANAELYEVAHGRRTLAQWLEVHGHRAVGEFDLAAPRWREQPEEVRSLAERLRGGADPLELHRQQVQRGVQCRDDLLRRLGRADARRLDRLLDVIGRYVRFREDGKHYLMLGYELLRDMLVEAGRRLGVGNDVFFLTIDEVCEAITRGQPVNGRTARRRLELAAEARLPLPAVIDAEAAARLGEPLSLVHADSYKALPVSSGLAGGPARIVHTPDQARELGRGYVLVCPSTDPGWTPLFVNASALVLECGGTLSHGAVVAREMNIPAVVLPEATRLLEDGQQIIVDGRHGVVAVSHGETQQGGAPVEEAAIRKPPPPGRKERLAAKVRNIAFAAWGLFLLVAWLAPSSWLYEPSLKALDALLWPLARAVGGPATVAIIAAATAALILALQRLLTDNARLLEARRRCVDGPSPDVQGRILGAALVPLALLLGPMVMVFLWMPSRLDPAEPWNAPPHAGSAVTVQALVDARAPRRVSLVASPPLKLDPMLPSVHEVRFPPPSLVKLAERWRKDPSRLPDALAAVNLAALNTRPPQQALAELEQYLRDPPPVALTWRVDCEQPGRFPVTVTTSDGHALSVNVLVGERYPPEVRRVSGNPQSPIRAVEVIYPAPEQKRIFWAPLARLDWPNLEVGWLMTYLIVYVPAMLIARRALGVA